MQPAALVLSENPFTAKPVIERIFPSTSDFENLTRFHTEESLEANLFDYSNLVGQNPWGYEFVWYQNSSVAVWNFHLKVGSATSLNYNVRERTSLILLAGKVVCSTFCDTRHILSVGKGLVIEHCVFQSTQPTSADSAFLMGVKTPPLKGDLLRYCDNFGRAGKACEGEKQHSTGFDEFYYRSFSRVAHNGLPVDFLNVPIHFSSFRSQQDFVRSLLADTVVIPFLGRIAFGREVIADIGQALPGSEIPLKDCPAAIAPIELLQIASSSDKKLNTLLY